MAFRYYYLASLTSRLFFFEKNCPEVGSQSYNLNFGIRELLSAKGHSGTYLGSVSIKQLTWQLEKLRLREAKLAVR